VSCWRPAGTSPAPDAARCPHSLCPTRTASPAPSTAPQHAAPGPTHSTQPHAHQLPLLNFYISPLHLPPTTTPPPTHNRATQAGFMGGPLSRSHRNAPLLRPYLAAHPNEEQPLDRPCQCLHGGQHLKVGAESGLHPPRCQDVGSTARNNGTRAEPARGRGRNSRWVRGVWVEEGVAGES